MFKVVELLKRRQGMPVEDFQGYWRVQHAPLLAGCPDLRRHVQSAALPQGYRKGELLFDGIAESWFDSERAYEAFRRGRAWSSILSDRANFVDPGRTVTMPVDVHVIKDGAIPAGAVKNIEFVNRRPGMALEPFRAYWKEVHGSLAAKIGMIRRYEQNHLKLSAYAAGAAPPFDGLAVTWFAGTADMRNGAETPEYAATRADEPNFLPDGHLPIIIAREHVVVAGRDAAASG